LRRRSGGGLRVDARCAPFQDGPAQPPAGHQLVKDVEYLDWRYADSPRPYFRVDGERGGWAVVTHAQWHGFSSAVVCDAFGPGMSGLLRRCVSAVHADVAVAMVNRGEERAYLAAGFVPSPRSIRFIGKRLSDDAPPLPKQRDAWRFSLGDLDFF
jgi:hypothetical protein